MDGLGSVIRARPKNSLGQSYLRHLVLASGEDVHQITEPLPAQLYDQPDRVPSKPTARVTGGQDRVRGGILRVPPLEVGPVADDDGRVIAGHRFPESVELIGEGRLSGQGGSAL